jgi:hypothetical protein
MSAAGVLVFAAAAVAHLAFQTVVHVVVYPGLADAARTVPAAAAGLHARYTVRIGRVVAPVYGLLVVGTVAVVLDPPPGTAGEWLRWVAVGTSVATALVTALVAVPLHRALSDETRSAERSAQCHSRLRRADLVRLVLAAVQVAAAVSVVVILDLSTITVP